MELIQECSVAVVCAELTVYLQKCNGADSAMWRISLYIFREINIDYNEKILMLVLPAN